ncbi:MAG: histidine phosphatase family protein, partial [Geminicoccaceae bacterium]
MQHDWQERLTNRAAQAAFSPDCDRFIFLRHGQTEHNRQRICQGHADVPLNAAGKAQAETAASIVVELAPPAIRASDLMRVRQTADPVARRLDLSIRTDPQLRERAFGIFENQRIEGRLWSADHPSVETIEQFVDRSLEGFGAALQQDDVLLVTHGGLRRVLTAALGIELADWTAHNALPLQFTRAPSGWTVDARTAGGVWPADGPE